MNDRELEAFLAVAEQGSFTSAAKKLFITQSALSNRIEALETSLGRQLFLRQKGMRNAVLTESGRRLIPIAQEWRGLAARAKQAMAEDSRKQLSVCAVESLHAYLLARLLPSLVNDMPDWDIRLFSMNFPEIYETVENGRMEAGLAANRQYAVRVSSIPLFQEEMLLVCQKDAPFPELVHPSQLNPAMEVYQDWHPEFTQWHGFWFGGKARPRIDTNNMHSMESLLSNSPLFSIVPACAASALCQNYRLRACRLANAPAPRTVCLLLSAGREPSAGLLRLLALLKSHIGEYGGRWLAKEILPE